MRIRDLLYTLAILICGTAVSSAQFLLNPYRFGPSAPSYLNQNFEGTGYDNGETWNTFAGGGTIDPDYTTSPIAGSQSLRISTSSNSAAAWRDFTNGDSIYLSFRYRLDSVTGSSEILTLHTNGSVTYNGYIQIAAGGVMRVSSGGQVNDTSTAIPTATDLWVWCEIEKGTGANGAMRAGWSTTSTKPTLSASGTVTCAVSATSLTAQTGRVYLGTTAGTTAISQVYDALLIDVSPLP